MKKGNLLSNAGMRKVMGGDPGYRQYPGEDGGICNQKICSFTATGQGEVTGYCGLSMNGEQCRCIYNGGDPNQPLPASTTYGVLLRVEITSCAFCKFDSATFFNTL